MGNIAAIVVAIGSLSALLLWILKRWYTSDYKISKLKGQVDEITNEIVCLESRSHTYNVAVKLLELYKERSDLNRNIRRRTNAKPKGLFGAK